MAAPLNPWTPGAELRHLLPAAVVEAIGEGRLTRGTHGRRHRPLQ